MNHTSFSSLHEKRRSRRVYYWIILGLLIFGILVGPKVLSKLYVWQETQRVQKHRQELLDSSAVNFETTLQEQRSADSQEKTVSFEEKIQNVDIRKIPSEKLLDVPYICQNPFRNEGGWDFHDESCEEAALLQSYLFLSGETVTAEQADQIFRDMINWQEEKENFGEHKDLYGKDMKRFIEGYYDLSSEQVVHLFDLNKKIIQKVIHTGYPIIVPIKGELLKNPFYPHPGYHMLTVIGYSEDVVITNDVGTKRGEQYPYEWERFLSANRPVGNDAFVILSPERSPR